MGVDYRRQLFSAAIGKITVIAKTGSFRAARWWNTSLVVVEPYNSTTSYLEKISYHKFCLIGIVKALPDQKDQTALPNQGLFDGTTGTSRTCGHPHIDNQVGSESSMLRRLLVDQLIDKN